MTDETLSPRDLERVAWTSRVLGTDTAQQRASFDAGFRSYWRTDSSPTRIVMDSPPGLEDVAPWLEIRDLLEHGGVRVPEVLASDIEHGFLLLEDLGTNTYLHDLVDANADSLFESAFVQLAKLQAIAPPQDFPRYDRERLSMEPRLFDEWFCIRHLGLTLDCAEMELLDAATLHLVDAALAQAQVLVHRDFMPRNLMRTTSGESPAVIDFQGAVAGPIAYDPASLFKDAFISWPEQRVQAWLREYHRRAVASGLPLPPIERFLHDVNLMGVHRHLKILGIFARLKYRDGKPKYLDDAPRFIAYLDTVLPRHPQLVPLHDFIQRRVKPAMAAHGNLPR
ncbi:aminoglycoside phosphotransferase family protein [Solilutibacter silvestris]|uniref:Putative phosphotransferase n=1 Tax=Solilutibacter silvestris TaxID=1645665 RepID=A0A2K1Q2W9_9GAMM|nr:phosphotransferase [Lysobacter silvestris]PNS09389.1 putative phosphotransferase [Lysobacter silvestris]